MYKIERIKKYTLQLALNDEVLNIKLDGLKQFKKYLEAQERLLDIQHKMEIMSKNAPEDKNLDEMITLLGDTIIYMFTVLFGEENTQKIVDFFEGNYDIAFSTPDIRRNHNNSILQCKANYRGGQE